MSDDKSTDPYNGELSADADLGAQTEKDPKDEDALDDAAHLLPEGGGLADDGDGSGALP